MLDRPGKPWYSIRRHERSPNPLVSHARGLRLLGRKKPKLCALHYIILVYFRTIVNDNLSIEIKYENAGERYNVKPLVRFGPHAGVCFLGRKRPPGARRQVEM